CDRAVPRRPEGLRGGRDADGGQGMKVAVIGAGSTYTPELVSGLEVDELELTGDLDRALDGADFVLIQIRVGGQAARLRDETIPLACGCIGQETTGAGGLAKALRTVPVVLDIAERTRELANRDAWIVDFTNPV